MPETVIERAKVIAEELCAHDITELTANIKVESSNSKKKQKKLDEVDLTQMSLFVSS